MRTIACVNLKRHTDGAHFTIYLTSRYSAFCVPRFTILLKNKEVLPHACVSSGGEEFSTAFF